MTRPTTSALPEVPEGAEKPQRPKAEAPGGESPRTGRIHAPGFSPQDLDNDRRNPSDRLCRGSENPEHDTECPGNEGDPRAERPAEVRAEPLPFVAGMGNVSFSPRIQAGAEGRTPSPGRSQEHVPGLFRLRSRVEREPAGPSDVPVRLLRSRRSCGRQRRKKRFQGGARPKRLFGGSFLRVGGLTIQAPDPSP